MRIRNRSIALAASLPLAAAGIITTATGANAAAVSGFHQIKNKAYEQCIEAPGGALNVTLRLADCSSSAFQRWAVVPITSTSTFLVNQASGFCVEVNNNSSNAGEAVDEFNCNGTNAERWVQHLETDHEKPGVVYTEFRHTGTNMCLDTVGSFNSQLMQFNCDPTHSNDAQLWLVQ